MAAPEIKIIALSNVYTRSMHFRNKGDIEQGHKHTYDHATLLSNGSLMVEMLDENDDVQHSKVFQAPNLIFINKDKKHRLVALEDNTVCACIHAIRTVDEEIVDPEFLVEPVISYERGEVRNLVKETYKKDMMTYAQI